VIDVPGSPAGDDGHSHRFRHTPDEVKVVALHRPVAVDRVDKDLTCALFLHVDGELHRVKPCPFFSCPHKNLILPKQGLLHINGNDHRLASGVIGRRTNE